MIDPKFEIDDRALLARFAQFPATLRARLVGPITKVTETLRGRVVADEPSRTGKLKSQTVSFVDQGDGYVRGRVRVLGDGGHNVKAAALEYGARNSVRVVAHQMMLSHAWVHEIDARPVLVETYDRRANVAALSFLRGPAQGIRAEAIAAIEKGVAETVKAPTL